MVRMSVEILALLLLWPLEILLKIFNKDQRHRHGTRIFANCTIEVSHDFFVECDLAESLTEEAARVWEFLDSYDPPALPRAFELRISQWGKHGHEERGRVEVGQLDREWVTILDSLTEEHQHLRDGIRHKQLLNYVYKPKSNPASHVEAVRYYGWNWFELKALASAVAYLAHLGMNPPRLKLLKEALETSYSQKRESS